MLTLQAEEQGFVTVRYGVGEDEDSFLDELQDYYCSIVTGATSDAWNKERKEVVRRAVKEILHPKLVKETVAAVRKEALAVLIAETARR